MSTDIGERRDARRPGWLARTAIRACTAVAVIALLVPGASATSSATSRNDVTPTVVLVHGAWADSSSWDGVVRRLQHQGYPVVAFPNPLRSLAGDSASVADYLQTVPGPVVLVGHSYGGAVITNAAAASPNVVALVYVDAFIPKEAESVFQLATARPGSCLGGAGDPTKVFDFVPYPGAPAGDVDLYAKAEANDVYPGFAPCFANDLSPTRGEILASTQRPVTLSALSEPSGPPAWKTIPSWAVVGTADNVLPPREQLFMARRAGAEIAKIRASHLSMISHPHHVANVIIGAALAVA